MTRRVLRFIKFIHILKYIGYFYLLHAVPMTPRAQRGTALTFRPSTVAVEDCAAARDYAAFCRCLGLGHCRGLVREREQPEPTHPNLFAQSPFFYPFPVMRPFADWVAPSPLSQHNITLFADS